MGGLVSYLILCLVFIVTMIIHKKLLVNKIYKQYEKPKKYRGKDRRSIRQTKLENNF